MMNRIALAIAILLSTASSSLAGSWSVSYRASGEYTYSNNPNVPWETNPLPAGDGSVHFSTTTPGGGVPGCSSSGAITATLTWVPSEPGDTPPDKVTIIETAFAYANWSFGAGSASASNGKGDREKEVSQYSKESKGWHAQTRSVPPGTTQIVLDPVDMSADAYGDSNPTRRSMAECSYKVTEGIIAVDARSTAGTADSNKPRFFSGTNCVATGYANISPARIIRAELVINNETVNRTPRYPYNPDHPEDTPSSATVRAAFDSTHFSHNTPVTIKMRIYDHRGRAHIRELKAPTYNKGFSFANGGFDMFSASKPQMLAAGNRMAKANHLVTQNSSWVADEIGNHLSEYTVMFECSHGSATHFRDSTCLYNLSLPVEEHQVSGIIVSDAVSAKKDSSWRYVIPPYNLVVLNSCNSAGGSFNWDFGISGDARVCVGWDIDIWAGRLTFWNFKFWNLLAHGSEVLEAAIRGCTPIDLFGPSPGRFFPLIQGDPRTKLHGVYHGNGTQWAIPLNH